MLAFTNPSLNSYHRLVPGFEAPVNLVYSARNRSAAIRIPLAGTSPAAKRIEFRAPDPSCNPFLAFSAQLMAGLDGILNHIEPPEPVDKDLYELPPEEHAGIKQVPSSLAEAMDALEEDHDFLTAGDVFTDDLIDRRRQRHWYALPPVPVEGRQAAVLRREGLRWPVRPGSLVHRWSDRSIQPHSMSRRLMAPVG